jgi:hypothetical protein
MKKVIQYLIFIIVGNFLCFKFAFIEDNYRFVALFGFLLIFYSVLQLPSKITDLLCKRESSYTILINNDKSDKKINKIGITWLVSFILIVGMQACGFIYFFKNQEKLLLEKGVEITTIVVDKKLENRNRGGQVADYKYYIYYNYLYNGKFHKHSEANDNFEIGDTIKVKLLPEQPDNHIIIE